MGARPLISSPTGREAVPGQLEIRGFKIRNAQHRLGCRCLACGMIRRRKREKALRNWHYEHGIGDIYD